jgi:hypothetical protein
MESSLRGSDWDNAERYATALEEFTHREPLPWTDFLIARGRALAAYGRGLRDEGLIGEMKTLRDLATQMGWKFALPALEKALAAR